MSGRQFYWRRKYVARCTLDMHGHMFVLGYTDTHTHTLTATTTTHTHTYTSLSSRLTTY